MSLTSYRAAPPRVFRCQGSGIRPQEKEGEGVLFLVPGPWFLELSSEDLAATYSPAS